MMVKSQNLKLILKKLINHKKNQLKSDMSEKRNQFIKKILFLLISNNMMIFAQNDV